MKSLVLYVLLLAYATVIFKPVYPFVADAVSHILFLKQHLATVHFENGKYHVHKEIARNAKEEQSGKTPASQKKTEPGHDHIPTEGPVAGDPQSAGNTHVPARVPTLIVGIFSTDYLPPRA